MLFYLEKYTFYKYKLNGCRIYGERVAYIAQEICKQGKFDLDTKALFLLCAFHDIGAYKTDSLDKMREFETEYMWNHSVYGFLFLKYMTPLKELSEAVLYHHTPWCSIKDDDIPFKEYGCICYRF